ncbi:MAG: protein TolR [Alphaproteobacteria bacterium]|nr:protein TolR [Alphaproteobacteria bacterium]
MPGAGGYRSRFRRFARPPMSQINVTPFVDVMLVLLVVFMVTAPLLTVGVPVDLPQSQANPLRGQDEPLAVTIDARKIIYLQNTPVTIEELVPRLRAIVQQKSDTRIFVRGDKTIDYGTVMQVMGTLNAAGFDKVALITEMPRPTGPARRGG